MSRDMLRSRDQEFPASTPAEEQEEKTTSKFKYLRIRQERKGHRRKKGNRKIEVELQL